jgi:5'-nucleotidase
MGDDTIYSGTVGAAMEGYLMGIPAIAFSQVKKGWEHIDAAAQMARKLVDSLIEDGLVANSKASHKRINSKKTAHDTEQAPPTSHPWLLNVNMPNLPLNEQKGFAFTRLGRRHAAERVITQVNPRGETMYWIGGAGPAKDEAEGTDFYATQNGWSSITPLQIDLTDHQALAHWSKHLKHHLL